MRHVITLHLLANNVCALRSMGTDSGCTPMVPLENINIQIYFPPYNFSYLDILPYNYNTTELASVKLTAYSYGVLIIKDIENLRKIITQVLESEEYYDLEDLSDDLSLLLEENPDTFDVAMVAAIKDIRCKGH